MSVPALPAATVVLLRDASSGPEVFMVQRSQKSAFMPLAHVFPGGRVDPGDAAVPVRGGEGEWARMACPEPHAYQVAAVRETLEEAGVLLADGELLPGDRERVHGGQVDFGTLARERGWVLRGDALVYWSWWITPRVEARRYDTRFFVARVEGGDQAMHDRSETVHSAWWPVAEVLRRFHEGALFLAPPTFRTLWELEALPDVDAILEAGRRRSVVPIEPRAVLEKDAVHVLLPGDPEFPSAQPVDGPTRITLRGGRWFVHR